MYSVLHIFTPNGVNYMAKFISIGRFIYERILYKFFYDTVNNLE